MKRFLPLFCVALIAAISASHFASDSDAQETKVAAKEKTRKKPRGRLPNYYSQVVSETQRGEIYKLQADYSAKIEALQKQIDDLESMRDSEVRGVLTDEQQKRVDELSAAAKKKSDERRAKSKKTSK